jgi:hypothetical protein
MTMHGLTNLKNLSVCFGLQSVFSLRGSVCIAKYIPSRRNDGIGRYYSHTEYSNFELMSTSGEPRSMYNFVSVGCYDATISF